ncbi:MAG: hypothetical protein ACI8ZN_000443 [Bacteroidia bacterium]
MHPCCEQLNIEISYFRFTLVRKHPAPIQIQFIRFSEYLDSVQEISIAINKYNLRQNSYFYDKVRQKYKSIYVDFVDSNQTGYLIGCELYAKKYFDGYGSKAIYSYGYGPMILIQLDRQGNIVWEHVIDKNQITDSYKGIYLSYRIIKTDTSYQILYNKSKNEVKLKRLNCKSNLIFTELLLNGELSTAVLYNNEEGCRMGLIKSSFIQDGYLIVLCKNRRHFIIGRYRLLPASTP